MKHLKTYEDINYYQYTFDEVEHKLFGNEDYIHPENVNDENLLYLIKLYIIYKEGYKNTTPDDINISSFNKKDKIVILYSTIDTSTWIFITNEEEFINFINNPELFITVNKYNL